ADKGTLFLDEVGDMPLALQAKILRALQERVIEPVGDPRERKVDVRVIAATNKNLLEAVANKEFREDLYYRLNVFPIPLPPLRERSDKLALINRLLEQQAHSGAISVGIGPAALEVLLGYAWPGNVRQLRHVLAYACAVCDGGTIQLADLPVEVRGEQIEADVEQRVS
ncbi:sigma 54-interacting transcriptional regulator, partial [Marichromatium gracile]|uniref:sigma 54-interacting transcriptional regulator n=1 Tax=Marichromatium gracile TaxID=1048 RepID=UPI0019051A94